MRWNPGRITFLRLALLTMLSGPFTAFAEVKPLGEPVTNPNNQHVYILLRPATWRDSEAQAVKMGGHLVTIRNQSEQDWIFKTFGHYAGKPRLLWIGLSDTARKFHFAWSSGESVAYTRWAPGEPNNVGRGEDFVAIFYPGHDQASKWNDWGDRVFDPIGLPLNGVVEIIPPEVAAKEAAARLAAAARRDAAGRTAARTAGSEGINVPDGIAEIRTDITITNHQGRLELYWPLAASNYVLEATTSLDKPFNLIGYSETTNHEQGTISAVITDPGVMMFYRLRKP